MRRAGFWATAGVVAGALAVTPGADSQVRPRPRPEPVAETKLLMNGLAAPNFRGLGKTLQNRPATAEGWAFARGQALLVAETANLLMLRPPTGREADGVWLDRAADLREAAGRLGRAAAAADFVKCRVGVAEVANACNRCHQAFRVPQRVTPFGEPE